MLRKINAQERIELILLTLNESRIHKLEKIFNWNAKCSFLQIQQTRSLRTELSDSVFVQHQNGI